MPDSSETGSAPLGPKAKDVSETASDVKSPLLGSFRTMIVFACIVIIVAGIHAMSGILAPVLLAVVLAITIWPIIDWLQRKGVPGWLSALLFILALIVVGVGAIAILLSTTNEFRTKIPAYQEEFAVRWMEIEIWLASVGVNLPQLGQLYQAHIESLAAAAGSMAGWLISSASSALVAIFIAILILLQEPIIRRLLEGASDNKSSFPNLFERFVDVVQTNMVGTAVNSTITSAAFTVWLFFFGVDFALLWGFLTFFLGFIPNVGKLLAAIPPVVVAFIQYGLPTAAIVGAGLYVIAWIVDNAFFVLIGQKVDLSPAASFIAFLFWTWVLGPFGTILAFPLTVAIKSILESSDQTRWIAALMGTRGR